MINIPKNNDSYKSTYTILLIITLSKRDGNLF